MLTRISLVFVFLLLPNMGGCKTARMEPVDPIPVACKNLEQTRDIAYKALVGRRWAVVKEEPGSIHAMLSSGSWSTAIVLTYNVETVTIKYVDSNNLKYRKNKKGREYIHKNYNLWMKSLADDIRMMGRNVDEEA